MGANHMWNKQDEERMYPDYLKEAQTAYQRTADLVLENFLRKSQGEYTVQDYYALPDTCRVELMDGVIYNMASPGNGHQEIVGEIFYQLKDYIRKKGGKCRVMLSPSDVQLDCDDRTMVQPDLYVCCASGKELRWNPAFQGAPDMVVEVLSPSSRWRDCVLKYEKYRAAGVKEYWIVDPEAEKVTVYLLEDPGESRVYDYTESFPVHIYQGDCRISLDELFH